MLIKIWDSTSVNEIMSKSSNIIDKKPVNILAKTVKTTDRKQHKSFLQPQMLCISLYTFLSG